MGSQRHAQRPSELDSLDVLANDLALRHGQALRPFTDRLALGVGPEKSCRQCGQIGSFLHDELYQSWYAA